MGALLRRYWVPAAASCELGPCVAKRVRLFGLDLVLFRTSDGACGLVEERCPHRGASLALGRVDGEGIRCPYHGWKFDRGGACIEMPAENARPELFARGATRAYPVQELGGLVFAYLGQEPAPLLPRFDLFVQEGCLRDIGRALLPCNWLQIMENSVDPTHVEWLHGHHLAGVRSERGETQPTRYMRRHEKIGFERFEFGIVKRRVLAGQSEEDDDWRIGHPLVFPLMLRVGSGAQHRFQIRVPVDDTHTLHYWYSCYLPRAGQEAPAQREIPLYEVPWRDPAGEYLVDFVDGQDIMTWVSQGPIADRTRERLVSSDEGIVLLRRMLLEELERAEAGQDPLGTLRDPARNELIRLPQEREKYGHGALFLAETFALSHARYSPLRDQIRELIGAAGEQA
jgi:5,5'-dehydrodivanillate O-demethylase